MKKALIIILSVVVILGLGGFVFLKLLVGQLGDQIALQYEKTPETPYKLTLDTKAFVDEKNYEALESWVPYASIDLIQEKISNQVITVEDLVKFYGTRISKFDSQYNSVIRLNPRALQDAEDQDERIEKGEKLKPLTGVVVIVKDNVAVEGMETSAGSYALKDLYTKRNAFLVQTLVDEGAVVLGKANLSEFSNFMSFPSSNGFSTLGGQTFNAYGKFDVGGSSSGSCVAASLGFATVTVGTETAGSLIYPAGQNSVVAIKPTMGLISRDLIIPISEAQDTAGIIGMRVSDVFKVFTSTLKRDTNDVMSSYHDLLQSKQEDWTLDKNYLKGKRLGIVDNGSPEMTKIKADLEKAGAELIVLKLPEKANEINMLPVLIYGIKNDLNAFLANEAVVSPLKDLSAIVEYNKKETLRAPFGQMYLEDGLADTMTKEAYEALAQKNQEIGQMVIDEMMTSNNLDALVSISNELSGVYAPAHCPAVTVPSGYKTSLEPFGVTFVGGLCDDIKLLKIAYSFEQNTQYRVMPETK